MASKTSKTYVPTIGLEIHAELRTETKMFCDSKNDPFASAPNTNVCPVCMGHPGTLPVINKKAVEHVLRVGVALGAELADFTEFDRKNYFYPDIPKGYQISQYKYPLVRGGALGGVAITRVHLEEDTASSGHDEGDYSLIDFNRAGVPLMELVTEPVIHSAEEAGAFGRELQLLLRTLGVSEANMEKGEMRVEANISVATEEDTVARKFGTKVEVKNLNSFKAAEKAIAYEVARHIEVIESGGAIVQETRGWDDSKSKTFSQRLKEESHDYRYFPDPDLPKLKISEIPEFSLDNLRKTIPELPWDKRARLAALGLKPADVHIYVSIPDVGAFFEETIAALGAGDPKKAKKDAILLASNYISSDILGLIKKKHGEGREAEIGRLPFGAAGFAALIRMIENKTISSRGAKDILAEMFENGGDPAKIATERGLVQKSDEGAVKKIALEVIAENPAVADEYKKGKQASLQFLIGQGMKKSKGSANPEVLKTILASLLS
ncbi:MAG: Asp-tRNA(Asn)/Glu-tRNA(Gln) amidotransferase subunit GatB [Patescibacteria group bacterium]|nr:Asp-tRNA(Asn)/Glu-tRNA(Gln) amidotransferase subunit GatB [Patescibacteria group bacterium]MDE2116356.1 Asp-tRNA(Asn)/Glu-tRNA(Gln) amidotransferase subunit GatB [Patescibacteria group bacterium]